MSRWCSDEQERKDTGGWPVNLGKNDQPTQSRPRSMGPARSCGAGQWNRPAGVALVTLGLASGQILLMSPGHSPQFSRRVRRRGARGVCATQQGGDGRPVCRQGHWGAGGSHGLGNLLC